MKKLFIIPALLGAMFLVSCEDFLDINKSKDSVITTSVDQVLPVATFYASQICYDHAEYGVYMCQALTTGGKSQTGSYPYSQGWEFLGVNRHPMWRRHFYDLGANINKMNELAEQNGNYNAILIGRTIMLMSTMLTTDAFGDMPRSKVYQSNSPEYDTQAEVYEWMFKEADELLKLYQDPSWTNASTNLIISTTMDRIYGGDMAKWEAFCKGLRARLWLRKLPNWDNTSAVCEKIIRYADDALAGWVEPQYHYPGGATESNCPWGPLAPKINSWESRDNRLDESIPTTFFLHGILGSIDATYQDTRGYALDPRAEKIMQPRGDLAKGMLHLESNIGMDINNTVSDFPDLLTADNKTNPYTKNDGYIPLMTTEELMFIKAEAQYWAGDIAGAYATTLEATIENMKRYGIEESMLKDDDTTKYNGGPLDQYKRFFNIKLPGADKFTIADLMQQKYIAMYLLPEQWTDMRRYNYSSSTNGVAYALPGKTPVYVYDVKNVHNGTVALFTKDSVNFSKTYSLRRPFNLYEAYWCTPDDYGKNASLSPNAWVNRLNADTETETKYNKTQLDLMGYYTTNAAGEKILDYRVLKQHLIWAQKNSKVVKCADEDIEWMLIKSVKEGK
mgnify:CR=1 FL=1